ncbi:PREDICTED: uncharacterized protein LOC104586691 [Nelumbo nucifera]|uniref:Uncharacterized protein LOC104586691 n=1 Tax=Nelumbo nucifera TaxID=4432 RepID=A0A1U7YT69_NELNU|nr:PREDICTED: uncharacterized protein LOC104586691 [Nelumbo nucifera]XP_010242302.1 PREDICTED: uncharacterized protein LOC104586691 [Nelumbo nucifera]
MSSNTINRSELKPGDHIYSYRQAYTYSHHGVYVGNEYVIHFTSNKALLFSSSGSGTPCPNCGYDGKAHFGVIKSCLDCFLDGGKLYRYQYGVNVVKFMTQIRGGTCSSHASDEASKVIRRANTLYEGNNFGDYNLFNNNCEDFAVYCKTERLISGQAVGFTAFTTALVVGGFVYNLGRYVYDKTRDRKKALKERAGTGSVCSDDDADGHQKGDQGWGL